jgi:hypothetical protein
MDLTFVLLLIAIIYLSEKKVDTKILVGLGVGGLVLIGYSGSMEGAGCAKPVAGATDDKKCPEPGCTYKAKVLKVVGKSATCTNADNTDKTTTCTTDATTAKLCGPTGPKPAAADVATWAKKCTFSPEVKAKDGSPEKCDGTPKVPPVSPDCELYEDQISPSQVSPGGSQCKTNWLIVVASIVILCILIGGVSYTVLSKKKSPISSK